MTLSEEFVDVTIEANSLQEYVELLEQMFKDGYSVVDTEEIGVVRIAHLRKIIVRADDVSIVGSKSVGGIDIHEDTNIVTVQSPRKGRK